MKVKLQNMDIDNKRIILRVDYNVPIKDGKIIDDSKIVRSLKTVNYLIDHNCKIVILSHLGKVKREEDKVNNSLEVVAKRLKELVNTKVIFSKQTRSDALDEMIGTLKEKEIVVLENTRFEDVPNNLESGNDEELASYWSKFGDIFVMDAFASLHRVHASTAGIAKFIPSCIGFLVQEELEMLDKYVLNAEKPFTIIMGGAKVDDKLSLLNKLLPKCDHLLLMGGLANSFLKVLGINIGESLATNDTNVLNNIKSLLVNYKDKIMLPFDVIVSNNYDESYITRKLINQLDHNDIIKDISTKTLEEYTKVINESKTIFLNGTAGIYEDMKYANGTKELLDILVKSDADVIVGGGDSSSSVNSFKQDNDFVYISTGGGATLKYIESNHLDVLDYINDEVEVL